MGIASDILSLSWLWALILAVFIFEKLGWWLHQQLMARKEQSDLMMKSLDQTLATLKQETRIGQEIRTTIRTTRPSLPGNSPTIH